MGFALALREVVEAPYGVAAEPERDRAPAGPEDPDDAIEALGDEIAILFAHVHAAAAGKVVATGYMVGYEGYGNVVLVDVGDGYSNLYAHLSRVDVYRGNWVERGQQLGLAGCTGSCTGTHLHFELHRGGAAIDPSPFLSTSGP